MNADKYSNVVETGGEEELTVDEGTLRMAAISCGVRLYEEHEPHLAVGQYDLTTGELTFFDSHEDSKEIQCLKRTLESAQIERMEVTA